MKTVLSSNDILDFLKLGDKDALVDINISDGKTEIQTIQDLKAEYYVWIKKVFNNDKDNIAGCTAISKGILSNIKKNNEVVIDDNTIVCGNRKMIYQKECCTQHNNNKLEKILSLTKKEYDYITSGLYAISKDECRPVLQGIYFNGIDSINKLDIVCLDGYRLSLRGLEKDFKEKIVVHNNVFKAINKIKFSTIDMFLSENKREVVFKTDNDYEFISPVMEGNYINYKQLIDTNFNDFKYKTVIPSDSVLEAISDYKEKESYMDLYFSENTLTTKFKNSKIELIDTFKVEYNNDDFEICINPLYLIPVLKYYSKRENKSINFSGNSNVSPLYLSDGLNSIDLILPIRKKINKIK